MAVRVLVVADDPALATLLEYHLDREGFDVGVAASAEKSEVLADVWPPDLVVVDTDLARFGAVAVCRSLRDCPELRAAKVLMLTGWSEDEASLRRLNFCADRYLAKPFVLGALSDALSELARHRSVTDSPYPKPARGAGSGA